MNDKEIALCLLKALEQLDRRSAMLRQILHERSIPWRGRYRELLAEPQRPAAVYATLREDILRAPSVEDSVKSILDQIYLHPESACGQ